MVMDYLFEFPNKFVGVIKLIPPKDGVLPIFAKSLRQFYLKTTEMCLPHLMEFISILNFLLQSGLKMRRVPWDMWTSLRTVSVSISTILTPGDLTLFSNRIIMAKQPVSQSQSIKETSSRSIKHSLKVPMPKLLISSCNCYIANGSSLSY